MRREYALNREAYGKALAHLGRQNGNIVVLDADLSSATKTNIFAERFPERFFNMGIAEQNMVNVASGLAIDGKVPFVSTYPMFGCGRAFEQIRYCAMENLNINFVFTHGGLSLSRDGISHQLLEDLALMNTIPNMNVYVPSDYYETFSLIEHVSEIDNPCYIRLARDEEMLLFSSLYEFQPDVYPVLREGSDAVILTMGSMIELALDVALELEDEFEYSVGVVNVHTLKPLNQEVLMAISNRVEKIITLEEHNVLCGLGSIIGNFLSKRNPTKICQIGINDAFGNTGSIYDVRKHFGLDIKNIRRRILEYLKGESNEIND